MQHFIIGEETSAHYHETGKIPSDMPITIWKNTPSTTMKSGMKAERYNTSNSSNLNNR